MSIKQVAAAADVSVTTASRALSGHGRVGAATRERVVEAATRLGYEPSALARGLSGKPTATIAVLVPDITNPFFPEVVRGAQEVADRLRHVLLLGQTADDVERTLDLLGQMRRRRVDGLVLVGGRIPAADAAVLLSGLRVVNIDREIALPGVSVVGSDHRAGGRLATEHLIGLGHRRIACLAGPLDLAVARQRRAGYDDAIEAAGLPARPDLVVEADFDEVGGRRAAETLLARGAGFTGLVAANDLAAFGALRALAEAGLRVPDDVSVVGFDDIRLASYLGRGLTTVRQQTASIGRLAAELLIDPDRTSAEGDRHLLDVDLVVRGTTARP